MNPKFNDPLNIIYDQYSISEHRLRLPQSFLWYEAEADSDFSCRGVIAASPENGSRQYTMNKSWLTIGMFRDEGRSAYPDYPLEILTWSRDGSLVTFTTSVSVNNAKVGDEVLMTNTNVPSTYGIIQSVNYDTQTISMIGSPVGGQFGTGGAWRLTRDVVIKDENIIFRHLPSMKIIPIPSILTLFASVDPFTTSQAVSLPVWPSGITVTSTVYLNQPNVTRNSADRRFSQVIDENGIAIDLQYDVYGNTSKHVYPYKKTQNIQSFTSPSLDGVADVYDVYGFKINDLSRGPYLADDLITGDSAGKIIRRSVGGTELYNEKLILDRFNNLVTGAFDNGDLTIRELIQPVELNSFGKPVKMGKKIYADTLRGLI